MATCAALHLVVAAGSPHAPRLHVLVLVAMALVCLPCATHALLAPARRTWVQAGLVSAGMLAAHPLLGLLEADHAGHMGASAPGFVSGGMVVGPLVALCLAWRGAITGRRGTSSPGV